MKGSFKAYPEEVKELLARDEKYRLAVFKAWNEKKKTRAGNLTFMPSKLGVIVLDGNGEEVEEWLGKVIDLAASYVMLRGILDRGECEDMGANVNVSVPITLHADDQDTVEEDE